MASADLDRELRIHEAMEATATTPRIAMAMLAAFVMLLVQIGPELFVRPAMVPLGILVILNLLGLRSYFALRKRPRPKDVSRRRIRTITATAIVMGLAWGSAMSLLMVRSRPEDLIIIVILSVVGAFASVGIASGRVALGFSMPVLLMIWVAMLWTGLADWLSISLQFFLNAAVLILFSLQTRKATIASINLTLENTQVLHDRLEAEGRLRQAEAEAAKAEQQRQAETSRMQRNLINAIAFPMVLSHGNEALEVTPAGRQQFRVPDGPLHNVALSDFFVDPADQNRMIDILASQGTIDNFEVRMCDTEGNPFWAVVAMRPLKYDGKDCWLNSIYVIDARKRMEQDLAAAKDAAEATLAELKTTQQSLVHAEKMASLGQLTAGIAHEIKNPLNFVNNFSKLSAEMLDELVELLEKPIAAMDKDDREDAEDLISTIRGNLLKIDEHGRRADSIVKNMLLHSRDGGGEKQSVGLNALAQEAMNLAYHGARAADSGFNVELDTSLSPEVGLVECHPQELQRVFLNLCSNGMYAATKRTGAGGEPPRLRVSTGVEDGSYVVEVSDNGDGVPEAIREKIFQPFFTTKPTGEGTGLGLSMSYDIVKQHGGQLSLDSATGKGSTFRVTLPALSKGTPGEKVN